MSKILPKSMLSQSSQNTASNQSRSENTKSDVMFAELFGGAGCDLSSEETLIAKSLKGNMSREVPDDEDVAAEQPQDDLMALIASLEISPDHGKSFTSHQDDELEFEQTMSLPGDENPNAIVPLMSVASPPIPQGGPIDMPGSALTGLANMVFENRVGLSGGEENTAMRHNVTMANLEAQKPPNGNRISLLGQHKVSPEFIGPQPALADRVEIGENLFADRDNSLAKKITSELIHLRALRATNLEQQNAELDAEVAKDDAGELNVKFAKNDLTGAGLKQMKASIPQHVHNAKMVLSGERGLSGNDVTRLASFSSAAPDNASAVSATAVSGSGQSSGQTGQQGGSPAGSQSGGGLLNSLNALQVLDTAKDNWTEMLLQRVKHGLSGGKDQLDFQLNPRNLGKMRISLVMLNDRTNIQIQTETSAAASILGESEARLAQMLEAAGLRLGNLSSGQFQGFSGNGSDQNANEQSQNKTGPNNQPDNGQEEGEVAAEIVAAGSDNLINIQA